MTSLPEPQPEYAPLPPDPREFAMIPVRLLHVERRAQRDTEDDGVKKIVNGPFTWAKFEVLTVVPMEDVPGEYAVIEGQHRTLAVQALDLDARVPCMVLFDEMSIPDQAELGLGISKGRKPHTAYDTWMIALHAEHPHEVQATAAMAELGIHLGKSPATMTISAVATVRTICHGGMYEPEDGAALLKRTLSVIMLAWPTFDRDSNVNRWDRAIMLATAELIREHWDKLDDVRLAGVMKVKPVTQWRSVSGEVDGVPPHQVLRQRFKDDYNRGLRGGRLD